jgi:hypothetical protein
MSASAKTGEKKTPTASTARDDSGYISTHVIDLLALSGSEEEASSLKCRRKHMRKSPLPKARLKSTGVATVEGMIL